MLDGRFPWLLLTLTKGVVSQTVGGGFLALATSQSTQPSLLTPVPTSGIRLQHIPSRLQPTTQPKDITRRERSSTLSCDQTAHNNLPIWLLCELLFADYDKQSWLLCRMIGASAQPYRTL
ncbi:MAG: hypothetical protein ACE3JU_00400, partial [Paenibacillus sp.]|uniref:hypothetical protein n=1 Tax=Paenibacillus sp. TaxID=58172 RepID=UPI003B78DD92